MKAKVLITQWIPDEIKNKYADLFHLVYPDKEKTRFSYEEIIELIPEYDVLFTISSKVDKNIINAGKNLKVIANMGVGYDSIDVEYATKKKIGVINTPNSVTESTAELAVALMMAAMRKIVFYDKSIREGKWVGSAFNSEATEIFGHSLGIVGFGRIGRSFCKKAQAMGMKVYYNKSTPLDAEMEKELDVEFMSLDDIFSKCDCVSLFLPYTAESHHLVNEETFAKMKKGSYLINAARGPIVKESALVEALNNGTLSGAALDVFEFEPKVGKDLIACENVVMTPHVGTQTYQVRLNMSFEALDGTVSFLNGETPHNLVNKEIKE